MSFATGRLNWSARLKSLTNNTQLYNTWFIDYFTTLRGRDCRGKPIYEADNADWRSGGSSVEVCRWREAWRAGSCRLQAVEPQPALWPTEAVLCRLEGVTTDLTIFQINSSVSNSPCQQALGTPPPPPSQLSLNPTPPSLHFLLPPVRLVAISYSHEIRPKPIF